MAGKLFGVNLEKVLDRLHNKKASITSVDRRVLDNIIMNDLARKEAREYEVFVEEIAKGYAKNMNISIEHARTLVHQRVHYLANEEKVIALSSYRDGPLMIRG